LYTGENHRTATAVPNGRFGKAIKSYHPERATIDRRHVGAMNAQHPVSTVNIIVA
jgi:hypothetical protein